MSNDEVARLKKELESVNGRLSNWQWRVCSAIRRRIKQHEDNLAGWAEPHGFLLPTEPDPDERRRIRHDLTVGIEELKRLCAEIGFTP